MDDNIQHGIDDDPNNDPHKAKNIGGVGGAITGAVAGSAAGPLGTVAGAVVGGVVGAVASKAAIKEVDKHDNDNTITGIGHGATTDVNTDARYAEQRITGTPNTGNSQYDSAVTPTGAPNGVPGIQTGGHDADGSPDTRGITEKAADTLTGDRIDDKTGKHV
jgi:hypothetical protein